MRTTLFAHRLTVLKESAVLNIICEISLVNMILRVPASAGVFELEQQVTNPSLRGWSMCFVAFE